MEEDIWCQLTKMKEQYRRLKEEHQRLQLDYGNLEVEYKQILEALTAAQADTAANIEKLQTKNRDLERELFLLRPHIITAEAEELIRIKAVEEIEKRYVNEIRQHVAQMEALTLDRNDLRRENDFLKGELVNVAENVERTKSEYRQRLESEISALQRQRDAFMTDERSRLSENAKKMSQLDHENRHLTLKLNSVIKENEELTDNYQKLQNEYSSASRDMNKKVAALNGQLSALIAERDCCRQQGDMLSREIASLSESNVRLTSRIHDLERQNGHLQAVVDEMTHTHAMELNNAKLQHLNEKSNIERERTDMRLHLKECEAEREHLRQTLDQKANALVEKDRECQHRLALAQEELVRSKASLEDQISELNAKLADSERRCRNLEDKYATMKDQSASKLDALFKERDGLSLEIIALKEELTRLRNRPDPAPVVIPSNPDRNVYPSEYVVKIEKKVQTLKEKLKSAKHAINELKNKCCDGSDMLKRLEEKHLKLRTNMEEFCRAHARFSKLLETGDEAWNKENCCKYYDDAGSADLLNMVRFLNDKVSSMEQRTVRHNGFTHSFSPPEEQHIGAPGKNDGHEFSN